MASIILPVDPEKSGDAYYRYTMPAIQIKIEGSGNGIKTVIPNIIEIAEILNRPVLFLMKYFQVEFGSQSSSIDSKHLLMGSHSQERLQDKLYEFIRSFVLCGHCRNPETDFNVTHSKKDMKISLKCSACGKMTDLSIHRSLTVLKQIYKRDSDQKPKGKKDANATPVPEPVAAPAANTTTPPNNNGISTPSTNNATDNNADKEINNDKPKSSVEANKVPEKSDLEDIRGNACSILSQSFLDSSNDEDKLITRTIELMNDFNLEELFGPITVLHAIAEAYPKGIIQAIRQYAGVLRHFTVEGRYSKTIESSLNKRKDIVKRAELKKIISFLNNCALLCKEHYDSQKFVILLFVLFMEGIVSDTDIANWYAKLKEKKIKCLGECDFVSNLETEFQPLINWLSIGDESDQVGKNDQAIAENAN